MQRNMQRFNDPANLSLAHNVLADLLPSLFTSPTPHRKAAAHLDFIFYDQYVSDRKEINLESIEHLQKYFSNYQVELNDLRYHDTPELYKTFLGRNFIRLLTIYNNNYVIEMLLPIFLEVCSKHQDGQKFINEFVTNLCFFEYKIPNKLRLPAFIQVINHPLFDPMTVINTTPGYNLDSTIHREEINKTLFSYLYSQCKTDSRHAENASILIRELFKLEKFDKENAKKSIPRYAYIDHIHIEDILNPTTYVKHFLPLRYDSTLYLSLLCRDIFLIIGAYSCPHLKKMPDQAPSENSASIPPKTTDDEPSEIASAAAGPSTKDSEPSTETDHERPSFSRRR